MTPEDPDPILERIHQRFDQVCDNMEQRFDRLERRIAWYSILLVCAVAVEAVLVPWLVEAAGY